MPTKRFQSEAQCMRGNNAQVFALLACSPSTAPPLHYVGNWEIMSEQDWRSNRPTRSASSGLGVKLQVQDTKNANREDSFGKM